MTEKKSIWAGSITGTIVKLGRMAGHDPAIGGMADCLQAAADRITYLELQVAHLESEIYYLSNDDDG